MFHRYFYDRVKRVKGDTAGENFVAITDPGTQLVRDAARDRFRRVFLNMPDIGGPLLGACRTSAWCHSPSWAET